MGVRFPGSGSNVLLNTVVAPGEALAVLSPTISPALDNQQLVILWSITWLGGATGPVVSYNIRRGSTTAATLLTSGQTVTEANSTRYFRSGVVIDVPGIVANVQYGLFLNVTNAASGVTINDVAIMVMGL
jgi:hypothetical protein